jgi:hypothetical protein
MNEKFIAFKERELWFVPNIESSLSLSRCKMLFRLKPVSFSVVCVLYCFSNATLRKIFALNMRGIKFSAKFCAKQHKNIIYIQQQHKTSFHFQKTAGRKMYLSFILKGQFWKLVSSKNITSNYSKSNKKPFWSKLC